MTEDLTLEDLTKEEIIILCRNYLFNITQWDMRRVRFDSLAKKAKQMADEANAEMSRLTGLPGMTARVGFLQASEKFDKAMDLYHKADKMLEEEANEKRNKDKNSKNSQDSI